MRKENLILGHNDQHFQTILLSKIKRHEAHQKIFIYSEEGIEELASDIEKNGLLSPLVLNSNLELLDGYRRYLAVCKLGWFEVEATILRDVDSVEKIVWLNGQMINRRVRMLEEYNKIVVLLDHYKKRPGPKPEGTEEEFEGGSREYVASLTGYSDTKVKKIKRIGEEFPELFEAIDEGMSINMAHEHARMLIAMRNADSVFFSMAVNGHLSVKEAYDMFREQQEAENEEPQQCNTQPNNDSDTKPVQAESDSIAMNLINDMASITFVCPVCNTEHIINPSNN